MNEVVPEHLRGGLVDIHGVGILMGYFAQGWVRSSYISGPIADFIMFEYIIDQ